jgi:hypothetical protein
VYRVIIDPEVINQIDALPVSALIEYARVHDVLEVAPWNGPSHNKDNPDAKVRRWLFGPCGAGQVIYLVLERDRAVHVVRVLWVDLTDS